jgi:hypothetical protein
MISILYGDVQEHFNQGVGSFVDGRRAHQERPRIEVIMGVQEELSPELDACYLQLLLQVWSTSSDIILGIGAQNPCEVMTVP